MKFIQPLSIALVAIAFAVPAAAQNAPAPAPVTRDAYTKQVDGRFAAVDANKDGTLTQAEISAAEMNLRKQVEVQLLARRKAAFEKADTNKDGSINFAEFSAAVPSPKMATDGKQSLSKLDANKDGKVSQAEFRTPAMAVFNRIDANKDGTATVDEQRKAQGNR